jgi:hypothetical protein
MATQWLYKVYRFAFAAPLLLGLLVLVNCAATPKAKASDAFLQALQAANVSWQQGAKPTLVVAAVALDIKDQAWQDHRVGFGAKQILAESWYETQKFALSEQNAQITDHLQQVQQMAWAMGGAHHLEAEIANVPKAQGFASDFITTAKIVFFGRPRAGASVGIVHADKRSAIIRVQVSLIHTASGQKISAMGEGQAGAWSKSVAFAFEGDRARLDQSAAGIALRDAIKNAVNQILVTLP